MRRFQMMLDEELDDALEARAARDGVSKAELLRSFARDRLLFKPIGPDDPIWDFVGGDDGPADETDVPVSENVNQALYGPSGSS